MTSALDTRRRFEPGTLGWTADDLDDPAIERQWLRGRYEIVDGVLTTMPPAYFPGGAVLFRLMHLVQRHLEANDLPGTFSVEVDRQTKRRWYAEAGVPHYWIVDVYARSLECLMLEGGEYRVDQAGRNKGRLRPAAFPGLVLPLEKVLG